MTQQKILVAVFILALAVSPQVCGETKELGKGKRVTLLKEDFEIDMERVPKEKQFEFMSDPMRIERSLATIVRTKTFAAVAKEKGLDKSAEFKARLKAEEERILARMLLAQASTEVKLPDLKPRARELYIADPQQSTEPEKIRGSHIMVSLRGKSPEDAMNKITAIREEVMKDPSRFGDIAVEKSEDDSAKQNKGDMGLLPRGRLTPEVENVLFNLKKPGEVSEVIKGPTGLHIVQVHEIVPSRRAPFEEVQATFLARAERAFIEAELYKLQENWLKDENFKFSDDAIDRLLSRFEPNSVVPLKDEKKAEAKK